MSHGRVARAALVLALLLAGAACADPFLDAVVQVTLGDGGGGGGAERVLGPPRGAGAFQGSFDTLSLGLNGSIVVAFTDNVVVDRPGPDFTVFENPFLLRGLTTLPPYAEPATVSVSADGEHWATFPCALAEPPYYPGCAGVYPVFADADDPRAPSPLEPSTAPIESLVGVPVDAFVPPAGSGGDTFDLAAVGLSAARFVRIDASDRDPRQGGLSGFDLDAIAALHSVDTAGTLDTDGDGIPDPADGCPALADPAQLDGDGDGVGDACDACPDVPAATVDGCPGSAPRPDPGSGGGGGPGPAPGKGDADGDGAPDASDPCPDDPACGPYLAGGFAGTGREGAAEALITWTTPTTPRMHALAGRAHLVVAIRSDVTRSSVRLKVAGRDQTAAHGPFVPGSVRTLDIPTGGRRLVVALRASAIIEGRRRTDHDRIVVTNR